MSAPTTDLAGLRVAAFESRRAEEMAQLIRRSGGVPVIGPSLREVPLDDHREAIDFANLLITGQIDVVLFMTGVGTRLLVSAVERHVDRQRFLHALSDVVTVARGPKPVAALKELGLDPTHRVPEPNTWRELLQTLDTAVPLANQSVALQEYGQPNPSLIAGLEARGARVTCVRVYQWDLPLDTAPLEQTLREIVAGRIDAMLFTSAQQVVHVEQLAARLGFADELRAALDRVLVTSIGPTTSETLRQRDWPVDLEPEHPKMGHLVVALTRHAAELLARKRRLAAEMKSLASSPRVRDASLAADRPRRAWDDSVFLRACRREPTERTPIWLMRQAGRYLPEYREIRSKTTFLELCKNPGLSAEVMIRTVERLGVDAAIIFSDLLPILEPMGFELEFSAGEGPVIHNPLREGDDVERMIELESVEALDFVMQTVRETRAGLPELIPVIGFAGAPFTLASYAIEGGASRSYLHTKTLMYRDPGAWHELLGRLARGVTRYLNAQLAAGAQAVQIFDSWVGCLGPDDYRQYVLPHTRAIIDGITPGAPVINFATGNPALLPLLAEAGGDVIGIDWRISLAEAWKAVGPQHAVQGNLDPLVLLATPEEIRRRAGLILDQAAGRPGHIFNLGHGVLPQTPVEHVLALIEAVRELSSRPLR
ncbi:MAG: uroporphyrinogen decarboxylase [Pirellulales bacterium]|nr:uroporphyrinogen decarboxylase [Pirellulales bacterium]